MSLTHVKRTNYYGAGSVTVTTPDGQQVRRLAISSAALVTQPVEGVNTVADVLAYAARTHGSKPAYGSRDVVKIHTEEKDVKKMVDGEQVTEKKKWSYFELSEYKYISYLDVQERATEVAGGLIALGVTKEEIINVYAATAMNWQLMSYGCALISTAIATAYETLGEDGLTHSLNEPNCVAVFTNAELLPTLVKVLPSCPSVRIVIYDGELSADIKEKVSAARENITMLSIDELRSKGKDVPKADIEARKPTPETVACIMYTSGSTGAPKGVVISNGNLVASIGAVRTLLGQCFLPTDTFLAYLPLAHILEYIVEMCMFFLGFTTGFGRVKTLTDASVRNCQGDIAAFKPTIMIGVPAVWELIRKGIIGKVQAAGGLKKTVFNAAVGIKKANVPVLAGVVDKAILSGVRAATGGRLRLAMSGGAALSKETQEFLSTALVTVLQGYGMTESCGMCAILPPDVFRYESVGLPVASVEIKLLSAPELGYDAAGKPPRGEVCIRGPSVIKGYYKRDDLNNDESIFTKDGWLRTGDVGQWNEDGTLSLIDRIKNLVKLSGGEYIALERLESTYKSCNMVSNICVHADQDASKPVAIIFPNEQHVRHALSSSQIKNAPPSSTSLHDLCQNKAISDFVLKSCNAAGKKAGFKPMETLSAVVLTPDEWTPESGLVTAAQKIQRKKIQQKFEKEIQKALKAGQ